MLKTELPGKRERRRPQRRFIEVMKDDMHRVGVSEEAARKRVRWRQMVPSANP